MIATVISDCTVGKIQKKNGMFHGRPFRIHVRLTAFAGSTACVPTIPVMEEDHALVYQDTRPKIVLIGPKDANQTSVPPTAQTTLNSSGFSALSSTATIMASSPIVHSLNVKIYA